MGLFEISDVANLTQHSWQAGMHPVPKEGRACIQCRRRGGLVEIFFCLLYNTLTLLIFCYLLQVGVRQVPKEGGLFEIIFYPFAEANGTLEVRVGFRV